MIRFNFQLGMIWLMLIGTASVSPGRESAISIGQQFNCNEILVMGAVRKPGRLDLAQRVQLIEVLKRFGGPNERAGKIIQLVHPDNCSGPRRTVPTVTEYGLVEVLRRNEKAWVAPGDIVTLFEAEVIFLIGNIRQRNLIFHQGLTLTRAIALAGGIVRSSDSVMVRINRQSSSEKRQNLILVSLKHLREHSAEDILLQAYDVVELSDEEGNFSSPFRLKPHQVGDPPLKLRHGTAA